MNSSPALIENSASNPPNFTLKSQPIEVAITSSPKLPDFNDLSLITPTNNRATGIASQLRQLWQYYREYVRVDPPDETVEKSLINTNTDESSLYFLEQSHLQTESSFDFRHQPNIQEPLLGFLSQSHLPKKIEDLAFQKSTIDIEFQPDWIETEVEDLGYARSPFAKILSWLDRVMLKVENWVIKIWHAIVNLVTSKQI
jgi:hypothetical protein